MVKFSLVVWCVKRRRRRRSIISFIYSVRLTCKLVSLFGWKLYARCDVANLPFGVIKAYYVVIVFRALIAATNRIAVSKLKGGVLRAPKMCSLLRGAFYSLSLFVFLCAVGVCGSSDEWGKCKYRKSAGVCKAPSFCVGSFRDSSINATTFTPFFGVLKNVSSDFQMCNEFPLRPPLAPPLLLKPVTF